MKFFLWILFFVALSLLAIFSYPIVKDRYFDEESTEISAPETEKAVTIDNSLNLPLPEGTNPVVTKEENALKIEIKDSDCENECARFTKESELKYCQETCGIAVVAENAVADCDSKSGLEKDYCLKNKAVAEKNFELCSQINDSGIKKTCKNRVTEDLLESQGF